MAPRKKAGKPNSAGAGRPLETQKTATENGGAGDEGVQNADAVLKAECEKAIKALRLGNSSKAVKLMKEAMAKFPQAALAQRVSGHIHLKLANMIDDSTAKQRHLRSALEAARQAASLSPKSVEYAHFYAQVLYESASDGKGYDEVVKECNRALEVKEPIDPAKEGLHDESQQELASAEARVNHMKGELKNMMQKANLASLSTWMKNFGNGNSDEKLRFLQVRKFPEDPIEHKAVQPRRTHEVRKTVKSSKERREEIEVRVAAARLMQQRQDNQGSPPEQGDGDEEEGTSGRRRGGDRRKKEGPGRGRNGKLPQIEERIERVQSFWKASTPEDRLEMLDLPIHQVKLSLTSSQKHSNEALEIFNEALSFAQEKKTWRFWACCQCGERFKESQEHSTHVTRSHIAKLTTKQQKMLPPEVEPDWQELLLEEDVRPIQADAAVKFLIENAVIPLEAPEAQEASVQGASLEAGRSEGSICSSSSSGSLEQFVDQAAESGGAEQGSLLGGEDGEDGAEGEKGMQHDHVCNGECQRKNAMRPGEDNVQTLPIADGIEDEERYKLLKRIHAIARSLLKARVLNGEHVSKVVQFAMEEMQCMLPEPKSLYEFSPSPLYIRFLNVAQLEKICEYLMRLASQYGMDRLIPDTGSHSSRDDSIEEDIIQDRLLLNAEFTKIHLDDRIMKEVPIEPPLLEQKNDAEEEKEASTMHELCNGQSEHHHLESSDNIKELVEIKVLEAVSHCNGELSTGQNDYLKLLVIGDSCDLENGYGVEEAHQMQNGDIFRETPAEERGTCEGGGEDDDGKEEARAENGRTTKEPTGQVQETKLIFLGDLEVSQERKRILLEKQQQEEMSIRRPLPLMQVKEGARVAHEDLQLSWIFGKMEYELQPNMWKRLREEAAQKGKELCEGLKKELVVIQEVCDEKYELAKYEDGLKLVESRCAEKASRKDPTSSSDGSYEALLRARKEEIEKLPTISSSRKLELRALDNVLSHLNKLQSSRTSFTRTVSDSDEDEEAFLYKDVIVEASLSASRKDMSKQQDQLERKLSRALDALSKQEARLNEICVFDYRAVVLSIVKSFLQNRLERAVEKDAQQKSDAAQAKFLEELAKDNESKAWQGEGKIGREKPKEKKKPKDTRRMSKEQKRTLSNGVGVVEGNGHFSLPNGDSIEDGAEEEAEWEAEEALEAREWREAELRRAAEVEEEERQLAQVLETQRRAEDQAKLLRLAQIGALESAMDGGYASIDPADIVYLKGLEQACEESLPEYHPEGTGCSPAANSHSGSVSSRASLSPSASGLDASPLSRPCPPPSTPQVKEAERAPTQIISPLTLLPPPPSYNEKRLSHSGSEVISERTETEQSSANPLALEEDEVQFQADLEQAMLQSLDEVKRRDSYSSHSLLKAASSPGLSHEELTNSNRLFPTTSMESVSESELSENGVLKLDEAGKGLQNEVGQYNCFLNVVIQSLWHLKTFRQQMLAERSQRHAHQGDPCVVCALYGIFAALNAALLRGGGSREPLAPTALRLALSAMYSRTEFFQESQMNDASEVLSVLFECLHRAFAPSTSSSDGVASFEGSERGMGEWECVGEGEDESRLCVAHGLFGLDVTEQMNCTACGLESRHFKYTTFFHNVNASALRTAKISHPAFVMDKLLRVVDRTDQLPCDLEAGGCGKLNFIDHKLRAPPQILTIVLGWQTGAEAESAVALTVEALSEELSVGAVYRGLARRHTVRLVSVVCYYGQHYHCFALNPDLGRWVMFDDTTVKVVGTWDDVTRTCRRGRLQAQVLFYEAQDAS